MSDPIDFDEFIASKSPSTAGFSREGGRATMNFWLTRDTLIDSITTILGGVVRKGDGSLSRKMPLAHPLFGWMTAEKITNLVGHGQMTKADAVTPIEGQALNYVASYPFYLATVEFVHQPYALLADDAISVSTNSYYDDDGATQTAAYVNEYDRFLSIDFKPAVEIVTANYGFMKFRRGDSNAPNGNTFPGQPRVYVGKSAIVFRWHFVPFSMLLHDNTKIVSQLGRLNQFAFLNFPAGSLLYNAVGIKRYVAPVPEGVRFGNAVAFSHDYRADVEFICEWTKRTTPSAPTPNKGNWLAAGHNLYPWFGDRKFYYVTAEDGTTADSDNTKWSPTYLSFPFEWLFTDPAVLPA